MCERGCLLLPPSAIALILHHDVIIVEVDGEFCGLFLTLKLLLIFFTFNTLLLFKRLAADDIWFVRKIVYHHFLVRHTF